MTVRAGLRSAGRRINGFELMTWFSSRVSVKTSAAGRVRGTRCSRCNVLWNARSAPAISRPSQIVSEDIAPGHRYGHQNHSHEAVAERLSRVGVESVAAPQGKPEGESPEQLP